MKRFFKDTVLGYIRNDWPLKLVSILLAIVIWFFICEYVDPKTDVPINDIPITVNFEGSDPQQNGLGIMTDIDQTVSFRVSGSRDAISMRDNSKITATLNLSNITTSNEWDVPVEIDLGGQNIEIVKGSQTPETIKVKFDKMIGGNVPVNVSVKGKAPKGSILEEPSMVNNFVEFSGPQEIVKRIVSAEIEIEQDEFTETTTFNCDYKFIDEDGEEVPKTFLKGFPEKIEVKVGVVQKKSVPFSVNIINSSGGNEAAFCKAVIDPQNITITGGADVLAEINSINLGVIDIAEKTEDFELTMPVVLQDGVKNVDNIENVKVSVSFVETQQQTFSVSNIIFENLPDGTKAKIQEKKISVKVRGLAADIKALKSKNIKLIVNMKNQAWEAGTYRLNALVDFPDNLNVGAIGKYQITVVVT